MCPTLCEHYNIPAKVLLTDITYLTYNNGKRAYLSTIKDSSTNEILAYNVSSSLKICNTLDEVRKEVNEYMKYYNNYRYQWNLNKMTPVQYRNHLVA